MKTQKECVAEALTIENQERTRVREEYEKRKKALLVQKKIQVSQRKTQARIDVMRARDAKMNELKHSCLRKLGELSKEAKYKELVRYLIAQGLLVMQEQTIKIQCRQEDLKIVQAELEPAVNLFKKTMSDSTGIAPTVTVSLDDKFLAPGFSQEGVAFCAGGVLLSARNDQIICRNTLDHRLDLAFEQLKPQIRGILFGVRERVISDEPVSKHKGGVSLPK